MNYKILALCIACTIGLWFIPAPEGMSENGWHLLSIFIGTILAIVTKPVPMGLVSLMALATAILTGILSFEQAFKGFSNDVVWMIVFAFFIARGFIKTGIGLRISYYFMRLMGKKSLGLAYGMTLTDLILAPAIPSTTARSGGIVYPIVKSLAYAFESTPFHPSAHRIGTYLTLTSFQISTVTSAMFLTGMAANPLVVSLAAAAGIELTWSLWALAALLPGVVSLILIPYLIYKIAPPGIQETPHAPEYAKGKLQEMGPITRSEKFMLITFVFVVVFWIFGPSFKIAVATTALIGVIILLLTKVLDWKEILEEGGAWETLIWFSTLLTLASELNKSGVTTWLSGVVSQHVSGLPWVWAFAFIVLIYFYAHYFFASNVSHVSALFSSFLAIAVATGAPPYIAALALGYSSSLFGGLTHYGSGPAALMYGSGYVKVQTWWKIGSIISLVNIVIWGTLGTLAWKFLNLW